MGFWSKTTATPTLWQASGFSRLLPDFIRTTTIPLPTLKDGEQIRRLNGSDLNKVGPFWQRYYSGDDWELDESVNIWARQYLQDPDVIVLGLFNTTGLVATIVSTPLGNTIMSHGAILRNTRVIEGLCVHDTSRQTGVAGFMIEYMDAYTSTMFGPTVHFWSRELHKKPVFSTALTTDTYAYIQCAAATTSLPITPIDWTLFQQLWISNSSLWCSAVEGPSIVALTPKNRRNALTVLGVQGHIVVVSRTGRQTKPARLPIWEVVWCGVRSGATLRPAAADERTLTSVAAYLQRGLLFASSAPTGGGVRKEWTGWQFGRSGVHAWYIYNYIPPAFGSCTIHAIREEI